jgi:hypothetical protein
MIFFNLHKIDNNLKTNQGVKFIRFEELDGPLSSFVVKSNQTFMIVEECKL